MYLKEEIEIWLKELETKIEHGKETKCSTCETGDEVLNIGLSCNGGYILEDDIYCRPVFTSPENAWLAFKYSFNRYLLSKRKDNSKCKIYWRQKPILRYITQDNNFDLDRKDIPSSSFYHVHARCFIESCKRKIIITENYDQFYDNPYLKFIE